MRRLTLILLPIVLVIFSACSKSETVRPNFDEELTRVDGLRTISDINSIAFEWQPVRDSKIKGYYLYRGEENKLKRVAKIDDKFTSHYVDTDLKPNTLYKYQISTFSDKFESKPSNLVSVKTLRPLESVVFLKAIENLPRKVKLIWRPHSNPRVESYIIERKTMESNKWNIVGKIKNRLQVEYIDSNLKDNTIYNYRVKIETFDKLISMPSQVVKAKTKPLLPVVKNLQATTNKPNVIVLKWDDINSSELGAYNLYRSDNITNGFKLYKKINGVNFTDTINKPKAIRFYKISAVDKENIEGLLTSTPVMGVTLDVPASPIVNQAKVSTQEIIISWDRGDERAKKYIVNKKEEGWGGKKYEFVNIEDSSFIDRDIKAGVIYTYIIRAVDEFNLISNPSVEIKAHIPKKR